MPMWAIGGGDAAGCPTTARSQQQRPDSIRHRASACSASRLRRQFRLQPFNLTAQHSVLHRAWLSKVDVRAQAAAYTATSPDSHGDAFLPPNNASIQPGSEASGSSIVTTTSAVAALHTSLHADARAELASAESSAWTTAHTQRRIRLPSSAPFTWTFMLSYIVFMIIVPIIALLAKSFQTPAKLFLTRAMEPVAMHAYYVSFSMALVAAAVNAVFGFLLAWVLVKYDFPMKKWIDAAVDLPFALPTSVAGLTLATVYSDEGVLGRFLESIGIQVVFTRLGVAVAMVFVSFPFVVRTMQPVLQEMEREMEEAAWTLGASPWKTFTEVVFPPLVPPLLTGTALAFSRALGEFGSIVIISSNFAFKDLIAPVLIFQCLEQYDFMGATIIGTVLLGASLVIMLCVNQLQTLNQRFKK